MAGVLSQEADGCLSEGGSRVGSRRVKVAPLPGSLSTVRFPPMRWARWREMSSPSPVPPKRFLIVVSAWAKGSNIRDFCSEVIPMPVSETAIVKWSGLTESGFEERMMSP